jgi:CreA protein
VAIVTIVILGLLLLGGDASYRGVFWLIIDGLTWAAYALSSRRQRQQTGRLRALATRVSQRPSVIRDRGVGSGVPQETMAWSYRMVVRRLVLVAALVLATPAAAELVGEIGTDWTGNDIVIEAIADPKVKGVTCHITYFSRGMIDRLRQGNWFEDPSNSSIACRQTGPMVIDDIEIDEDGEEIFSQRQSLIFKALAVRRVYDQENDTLIYISFSHQIQEASAKMAVSTIPLFDTEVTWANGRPK